MLSFCAQAGAAGALHGEDAVGEIQVWLVFGNRSVILPPAFRRFPKAPDGACLLCAETLKSWALLGSDLLCSVAKIRINDVSASRLAVQSWG